MLTWACEFEAHAGERVRRQGCSQAFRAGQTPRLLSQTEVERLAAEVPDRYRAQILVSAYAGLQWGEAAGLTRGSVDVLRPRIVVRTTAVEVRGRVPWDMSRRLDALTAVPVARSIMRRIEEHAAEYVGPESDALVFTASNGGPLFSGRGRAVRGRIGRSGRPDGGAARRRGTCHLGC